MGQSALGTYLAKVFDYDDLDIESQQKRGFAFELIMWTLGLGVLYAGFYYILELKVSSFVIGIYITLSIINIYVYYLSKSYKFFKNSQLILILLLPIMVQLVSGGYTNSGAVGIAAVLAPLGALIFTGPKKARVYFYIFLGLLTLTSVYEYFYISGDYIITRKLSVAIFAMTMIFILSVIYFVMESFVKKNELYQKELSKEKEKSESLLLNILPASVALELKESGWSKAKGFASTTVVFTDFVRFSSNTRLFTPGKLVEQLDIYFRAFDDIMEKYGLEKIKTIGDAYLFAGGIPIENHTHATDAVTAALHIQEKVTEISKSKKLSHPFQLRVGVHTGPLVAGVVGKKKFAYDIWGDTVNVAARIEQNGIPGKVLVSESTYHLISNDFNCNKEATITAKNIGELEIYSVEAITPGQENILTSESIQ